MAQRFAQHGILTICLDYRNFPQGTISDMVKDAKVGIQWCLDNVYRFNGDRDRVWIVGQSAGAHIGGLVLIDSTGKAADDVDGVPERLDSNLSEWSADDLENMVKPVYAAKFTSTAIAGFIGVSGPYNLRGLPPRLSHNMKLRIFEGDLQRWSTVDAALRLGKWTGRHLRSQTPDSRESTSNSSSPTKGSPKLDRDVGRQSLRNLRFSDEGTLRNSPEEYVKSLEVRARNPFAIPIHILHGSADKSVPVVQAAEFATVLSHAGFQNVKPHVLLNQTHTDPIIENCIVGGEDELVEMIANLVKRDASGGLGEKITGQKLIPKFLVKAARFVNPF
jgi:acetyl esterase/lipase